MAANSGGVEWASIIKPIVSAYSYSSVNKHDLLELCSAINKRYIYAWYIFNEFSFFALTVISWRITYLIFFLYSESEILHHKDNFKVFYNCFAILAADYISVNASSCKFCWVMGWVKYSVLSFLVSVNHMDVVCNACRVLLRYLLNALQTLTAEPIPNAAQATRLLNAIKSLCLGTGLLSPADQATLTQTMKSENLPPHIKTNTASGNLFYLEYSISFIITFPHIIFVC